MKRARKQFFSGSESRQNLAAASSDAGTPLALKTNAATDSLSANGATVITSLGRRPRIPGAAKPAALKARFFLEMCS